MTRRMPPLPVTGAAGWLFADLLLVLFLVSLVSITPDPTGGTSDAAGTPSASSTTGTGANPGATSSTSGSTRPSRSGGPVLERGRYETIVIEVPFAALTRAWGERAVLAQLGCELQRLGYQRRRAGFVLAFGGGPNTDAGINAATIAAGRVNSVLRRRDTFADIASHDLWTGGPAGRVKLYIYFFEPDAKHPAATPTPDPPGCPRS